MIGLLARMKIRVLRVFLSALISLLNSVTKLDEKLVMFASFNGKSFVGNPRVLFRALKKDPDHQDLKMVWALQNPEKIEGAECVKFNSLKYYYLLSKAKYWVFNAKMAPYYKKREGQIYLQTWHGTPLKRLGHDIDDNGQTFYRSQQSYEQMLQSYDSDRKNWDYLLSPNLFSTQAFQSAFQVEPEKIIETGYPRVDVLVNRQNEDISDLKKKYHLPLDKKVILYAPTWRDNLYDVNGYVLDMDVNFRDWSSLLKDEYVVLFKPHYLISECLKIPEELSDFVYNFPACDDINEAYLMSDLLVTDYSSVFFDYAVLNRPIYFYMYDFKEYEEELRGFYLDIPKDLPNEVCYREDELLKMIKYKEFDYERLKGFNRRFNPWSDGKSTERIIKKVFK